MLTPAQTRALDLASNGYKIVEIAFIMGISVRTVEAHLSEARSRLDANNTTHAVAKGLRGGIIKMIAFACAINALSTNYEEDMRAQSRVSSRTVRTARKDSKA